VQRVQQPNLGIDTESFDVYSESFRFNPQILNVNTQLLWSILKFDGQLSNLVINPQIWGLTLKSWGFFRKDTSAAPFF